MCEHYSSDDLYIPPRIPGKELPKALHNFYQDLIRDVFMEHTKQEKPIVHERKSKKGKLNRSPRNQSSEAKVNIAAVSAVNILDHRTQCEIEEILIRHIQDSRNLMKTEQPFMSDSTFRDPIKSAILESEGPLPEPDPAIMKEGIVIVFHGAPFTEYLSAANKMARTCNLPVLNLDTLIYEALILNKTENCVKINELIDAAYKAVQEVPVHVVVDPEISFTGN